MISSDIAGGNCGGHTRGQSGTIISNGGSKECHWLIQVTQGKKVSLDFTAFHLGDTDKVNIYDGQKYEKFLTFTKENQPRAITGNSHFMRVIYIGGENAGTGFTLSYKEASMYTVYYSVVPCYYQATVVGHTYVNRVYRTVNCFRNIKIYGARIRALCNPGGFCKIAKLEH